MNTQNSSSTAVITTVDRATKTLTSSAQNLSKAIAELSSLAASTESLAADIQQKESQLAALDEQFNLQFRTKTAELSVRVKEAEDVVLSQLLKARNASFISDADLNQLKRQLADAQNDNSKQIDDAVAKASSALHTKYNSEIAALKSAHAVESATTNAAKTSLDERVVFLTGEITQLRAQLDAERQTRLEIAKADANRQGVVVNAGKQ